MAQLSKDSFAFGGTLMSVDAAASLLRARIMPVTGVERLDLLAADGRILAEDLVAPIDLPCFDNSAVDGYAVRSADLVPGQETVLPVHGKATAGHALAGAAPPAAAIRILTGAPMPAGLDMVFMQEDCRLEGDRVILPAGLKPGANRRRQAEDLARGTVALAAGRRLAPQDIGLAAALGVTLLPVRRRLKIAVFSTGDEIISPGETLRPATLYDANRFILHSLLGRLGAEVTDLGILPDNRDIVAAALAAAAAEHDLVVTSGGVSTGDEDHVKSALSEAGSLVFWRLAIKPGRPVAMGVLGATPFIGLPGNPVAVFVTFAYVLRPLIAALAGETYAPPVPLPVTAGFAYRKKEGRREYVRVSLEPAEGRSVARKYPIEGAGILTSLTRTQGLVELGEAVTRVEPGDAVGFIDYALLR